ncbi:uncharacterized protein KGF55_005223 [Candida pseudojiufengensis]|uniref:uncharacterized protein n=1 Tax=Candida pseudojiufengensis TaxID=497109 RepID=UPI002224022D|nr:uncharacterized protein KGF55_005223 [Candida pseudojiufengensis]KAI5959579.1 hypothetical protein KGF55_005223 [Candida pseudojiufengensis]
MSTETVFVTGATGFIAQHIVKQLIEKGYKTIGSVRSNEKGENLKSLIKQAGLDSKLFSYVVVPDIIKKESFDKVFEENPEITVVLHTASPVDFSVKDVQKGLVDPAVIGTKNILSSAQQHKNIKHLVITSSTATVQDTTGNRPSTELVTEKSWNPITHDDLKSPSDGQLGYSLSKTLAGKEVVKFFENSNPHFTITSVLPTYVFGPQAFEVKDPNQLNHSAEIVNQVLKSKPGDTLPEQVGTFIDVRDVAHAHLKAFEIADKTNGKRLVTANTYWTNPLIAHIINKNFPDLKIAKGSIELSDKEIKDKGQKFDFSATREILGFDYVPLEKSVVDSVKQILATK